MEGVLTPEIWIAVAEKTKIPELRRTTRDEPDYDKLMRGRLAILDKHNLKLSDIQKVIVSLQAAERRQRISGRIADSRASHHFVRHIRAVRRAVIEAIELAGAFVPQTHRPERPHRGLQIARARPEEKSRRRLQVTELSRHFRRRFLQRHRDVARSQHRLSHPRAGKCEERISAVQSRRVARGIVEAHQRSALMPTRKGCIRFSVWPGSPSISTGRGFLRSSIWPAGRSSIPTTAGTHWKSWRCFAIVLMHEFGHQLACRSVGGQNA